MTENISGGVLAGIAVSLGGGVFLAAESRPLGAVLFAVALLCICLRGYNLFTGRVGFLPAAHRRENVSSLLLGLAGNLIGTLICGLLLRAALPALGEKALTLCTAKLEQSFGSALVRGVFCGMLMYLAVSIYKEKNSVMGILFCIPVFILSGFEHSIADMFYFAVSGIVSLRAFMYIWIIILGNSLGAIAICLMEQAGRKGKKT